MKKAETGKELGRIFLKSTSHVRVRETKGNYLRSIVVGFQFAFFLPYELVTVVVWPLIRNVCGEFFFALDSLVFVVLSAISAVATGFTGYLEASDELVDDELNGE